MTFCFIHLKDISNKACLKGTLNFPSQNLFFHLWIPFTSLPHIPLLPSEIISNSSASSFTLTFNLSPKIDVLLPGHLHSHHHHLPPWLAQQFSYFRLPFFPNMVNFRSATRVMCSKQVWRAKTKPQNHGGSRCEATLISLLVMSMQNVQLLGRHFWSFSYIYTFSCTHHMTW